MAITAGYDVGGAHLKVALAEDGRTIAARQIACPLWQGLDALDAAFAEAAPLLARADRHAATMTGELCELFPDRPSGVTAIVDRQRGTRRAPRPRRAAHRHGLDDDGRHSNHGRQTGAAGSD
jgi:uncharacterized hydantoinase/oxoprolinase family protein